MLILKEAGRLLSEELRNLETGFIGLEDLLGVLEFLFWEPQVFRTWITLPHQQNIRNSTRTLTASTRRASATFHTNY